MVEFLLLLDKILQPLGESREVEFELLLIDLIPHHEVVPGILDVHLGGDAILRVPLLQALQF